MDSKVNRGLTDLGRERDEFTWSRGSELRGVSVGLRASPVTNSSPLTPGTCRSLILIDAVSLQVLTGSPTRGTALADLVFKQSLQGEVRLRKEKSIPRNEP